MLPTYAEWSACAWARQRPGFTLIELLVVVSIMILLASIILAAWGPIREAQRRSRTRQILVTASSALSLALSERGSLPSPAEHPFAGSKQPRLRFRGQRSAAWSDAATAGEALAGVPEDRIEAASRDRLQAPDDVFNEPDLPAFYGLKRRYMTVFGSPQAHLTRVLNLASYPGSGVIPSTLMSGYAAPNTAGYLPWDATLAARPATLNLSPAGEFLYPYVTADGSYPNMANGNPAFPRARYLTEGVQVGVRMRWPTAQGPTINESWRIHTTADDQVEVFRLYLRSGVSEDLERLGALRLTASPGTLVAGPSIPPGFRNGAAIASAASSFRVWSDDAGKPQWEPGRIRASLAGSGGWQTYRLPGQALYDAWGGEILYLREGDGAPVFVSAGRDRCFAIRPGLADANGASIFATVLTNGYDGTPTAPDRDASLDNLFSDERQPRSLVAP
jgi:prepilin-type N-terminal cleavage/methylation domain-containing protein